MRRQRTLTITAAAVVLAVVVAVVLITRGGDPTTPRAVAESPTTSTSSTTTTTAPPADPWTTTIATAVVPTVDVESAPPPGVAVSAVDEATRSAVWANFAAYSPTPAARAPLPSATQPLQGRRVTATGWAFDNPGGFGSPLTFVVTQVEGDWLQVMIPVRPNGGEGWIRASDVTLSTTHFHVEIVVSQRLARLFDGTTEVLETPVVVGKAASWTPTGHFYITDFKAEPTASAYGPWILATNAYSQALDSFSDGAPVVAMHGTNQPKLLGTASSNGCIRFPNAMIQRIHDTVPLGTPIDIRP